MSNSYRYTRPAEGMPARDVKGERAMHRARRDARRTAEAARRTAPAELAPVMAEAVAR